MAKTYPTLWFNESMQGAAQTGDSDAGAMIAILKACLVDGFGSLVPDSIVWDETKALAKASFSAGHSYLQDSVIVCSGSAVTDYNGKHRIIEITSTEIYFELDTVPVAAASGSLEIKIAPLGWEITFANGTNDIIIFTPPGNLGNVSLRVDNSAYDGWSGTYARLMKVEMIENATDINTYDSIYEGAWPATGRYSDHKWDLVGDSRMIYFMPEYGAGKNQACFVAGYIDTIRAGDEYHFIINHLGSNDASSSNFGRWDQSSLSYNYYNSFASNYNSTDQVIARDYHQLEGVSNWSKVGFGSYNSDLLQVPNPSDNGYYINTERPMILTSASSDFRGYLPIIVSPLGNQLSFHRKNLAYLPLHVGKTFRLLRVTPDRSAATPAVIIGFDVSTVEV